MILSVSRRTDIPNYYSEWFFNRLKEGFLYVRNPMNFHQISKIKISPDVVDCIVFWTKNPLKAFRSIAEALSGYTEKCVISFLDIYPKNKKNMDDLLSYDLSDSELREFAKELSNIAKENHIKIGSCAEKIDLDEYGIIHNSCIDKELIEKIIGCKLKINKDKNQRIECGCVESVEVGTYNTCKNGCVYCYANYSAKSVESNFQKYDPLSPLLCGHIEKDDKISTRKVVSLKETQISIFDI